MSVSLSAEATFKSFVSFAAAYNQAATAPEAGEREKRIQCFSLGAFVELFDALQSTHGYETAVELVNGAVDIAARTFEGSVFKRLPIPPRRDEGDAEESGAVHNRRDADVEEVEDGDAVQSNDASITALSADVERPTQRGRETHCGRAEVHSTRSSDCGSDNSEMARLRVKEQVKADGEKLMKMLRELQKEGFKKDELVAMKTPVIARIIAVVDVLFDPKNPKLHKTPELLDVLLRSNHELFRYSKLLGKKLSLDGAQLIALPFFIHGSTRLGDLVQGDEGLEDAIDPDVESFLERARRAVSRLDGYKARKNIQKLPTNASVESLLRLSVHFRSVLFHVGNIIVLVFILWNTTVEEILIRDGGVAMLHRLEGLACDVAAPGETSVRKMRLFDYFQNIALPAFERGERTCMKSAAIVCEIISRLTGGTKNPVLFSKWVAADQCEVSTLRQIFSSCGDGPAAPNNPNAAEAAPGVLVRNRNARLRAARTALALFLKVPLRRRFPDWGFGGDDYALNLLLMAPTRLMDEFRFLKKSLFEKKKGANTKDAREHYATIKEAHKKKIESLAENDVQKAADLEGLLQQTLLFGNQEQIEHMVRLYSDWER